MGHVTLWPCTPSHLTSQCMSLMCSDRFSLLYLLQSMCVFTLNKNIKRHFSILLPFFTCRSNIRKDQRLFVHTKGFLLLFFFFQKCYKMHLSPTFIQLDFFFCYLIHHRHRSKYNPPNLYQRPDWRCKPDKVLQIPGLPDHPRLQWSRRVDSFPRAYQHQQESGESGRKGEKAIFSGIN